MNNFKIAMFLFLYLSFFTGMVQADPLSAQRACALMEGTGFLSEPCSIENWGETIDITLHTSVTEARKMCSGPESAPTAFRRMGIYFHEGWKLKIYTPYSVRAVATCNLRVK